MTRIAILSVLLAAGLLAVVPVTWPVSAPLLGAGGLYLVLRAARWADRLRQMTAVDRLHAMTPPRFEREVGAWFARAGFLVEHRGGKGDHGLDLVAFQQEMVVAIQCKRYAESHAVTPAQVREFYGAATAIGATHAVLVTTGRFSIAAATWAETLVGAPRVSLVGPAQLLERPPRVSSWVAP